METFNIRLTKEQREKLDRISEYHRRARGSMIRELIEDEYEKTRGEKYNGKN